MNFKEKGNSNTFKEHLKKVLYPYRDKDKVMTILDNVRYHHAKKQ